MKSDLLDGSSHYTERKSNKDSWQDIHGRDALAIFHKDPEYATKDGKERVKRISDHYPTGNLLRISISGPNETTIYVLAEEGHETLFNKQLRRKVDERKKTIETITTGRKRAEKDLEDISWKNQPGLFANGDMPEEQYLSMDLKPAKIKTLNRLAHWLAPKESELTVADAHAGNGHVPEPPPF